MIRWLFLVSIYIYSSGAFCEPQMDQSLVQSPAEIELELRKEIEANSYEFTRSLLYKYRYCGTQHKITPVLPASLMFTISYFDTAYRDSMVSWGVIGYYGFISPVYDGEAEYIFLARAKTIHRLLISNGYQKAVVDFANDFGLNAEHLENFLREDLLASTYIMSGASSYVGGSIAGKVVSKIARPLFSKLSSTSFFSQISQKIKMPVFLTKIVSKMKYPFVASMAGVGVYNIYSANKKANDQIIDNTNVDYVENLLSGSIEFELAIAKKNFKDLKIFVQAIRSWRKTNCAQHHAEFELCQIPTEVQVSINKYTKNIESLKKDYSRLKTWYNQVLEGSDIINKLYGKKNNNTELSVEENLILVKYATFLALDYTLNFLEN